MSNEEKTVRMQATLTYEYEADPDHYGTTDRHEMETIDHEALEAEGWEAVFGDKGSYDVEAIEWPTAYEARP